MAKAAPRRTPPRPPAGGRGEAPVEGPLVYRPGGTSRAVPRGARPFDPRYRISTMQKGMIAWSLFNTYFALLLTHISNLQFGGAGYFIDFILMFSCLMQLFVGSLLLRLPIRLPVAAVLLAILMVWAAATTLFANGEIGRSLFAPVQYYVVWGFFPIFIYACAEMGIHLSPKIRPAIVIPWLASLALSGIVGFLQVAGFGWARALSPTGAFGDVFRPTGLTDYTFMLGMQGVFGMAIIGARLRERNLSWREWAVVGFFMSVVLVAQYRSLYYTGIALTGALLLLMQYKRDRVKGLQMTLVGAVALAVPLLAFPQKFAYGLRGASNDPALQARYLSWEQLKPVLAARPFTGIGADLSLMITTGIASVDKYSGTVIDNFYRMVLMCYGYTGGLFMILTLVAMGVGLFMRYDSSRAPEVKVYTIAGLIVFAALLGVSTTGNSFVYRQVSYSFAVLLALGSPSWAERRLVDPVSPVVAWARTLAHSPLKTLFPNLGRLR